MPANLGYTGPCRTNSFGQCGALEGRGKWELTRPKPEDRVGVETAGPWALVDAYPRVGLTPWMSSNTDVRADPSFPQVIVAGISAIVLSRYLPSTPLVCGDSSDGTVGWVSSPIGAKHDIR